MTCNEMARGDTGHLHLLVANQGLEPRTKGL